MISLELQCFSEEDSMFYEDTFTILEELKIKNLINNDIYLKINEWLKKDYDKSVKDELINLIRKRDYKTLIESFYTAMEFGTGGLRGIIGPGTNRMNIYTVRRATAGLCEFLIKSSGVKKPGVVIAYDCRNKSLEFTKNAAMVLAAKNIKTYIFDDIKPTPLLSFAVRYLNATAGIIVTASHNPPQYNGYKVSDKTGSQVVPPWDKKIIEMVNSITELDKISVTDFKKARQKKKIIMLGRKIDKSFIDMVLDYVSYLPSPGISKIKVVYTPLHGTGYRIIPEVLKKIGVKRLYLVKEQSIPDGSFPTTRSPNPEEKEGLNMGLQYMEKNQADLLIATDPDADRVGIACRDKDNNIVLLTGNKTFSLMTDYVLMHYKELGKLEGENVVIKTIVTTDLVKDIASKYGVKVVETLTGFKYIGEKINDYEILGMKNGGNKEKINPENFIKWAKTREEIRRKWYQRYSKYYVLGGEESYGYSQGTFIRDKDSITSSAIIAQLVVYWKNKGKTLVDRLKELYEEFGYYEEGVLNYKFEGIEGKNKMDSLMKMLREKPLENIAGIKVIKVADLLKDEIVDIDGKILPKSDVVIFELDNRRGKVIARPSGTEPKIKFYVLCRMDIQKDLYNTRTELDNFINKVKEEITKIVDTIKRR
ncbi:MAG: phospho-sugar mutase [Candidatus Hydrogenedentota bacterium]